MSRAAVAAGVAGKLGLQRMIHAVRSCRTIGKHDMIRNDALPTITVDPETYNVSLDGEHAYIEPARRLPLTQLYFIA